MLNYLFLLISILFKFKWIKPEINSHKCYKYLNLTHK
jgi:hypothetical protein